MKLTFVILLLLACGARAQDTVVLRTSVRLGADEQLTLGTVARLDGPQVEALASLPLDAPSPVTLDHIRRALSEAAVNWATVSLNGRSCTVRRVRPTTDSQSHDVGTDSPVIPERDTIGALVIDQLGLVLGAGRDDLRVTFDARDEALLAQPVRGRTVVVRPAGLSSRMPLKVTIYKGGLIDKDKLIAAEVRVRRTVVVSTTGLARGDVIDESVVRSDVQWVAADIQALTLDAAIGQSARSRIAPGELIRSRNLEPPILARRGDRVIVHCLAGSIVLKCRARAMATARRGEVIEFQTIDRSRTFPARMVRAGVAVATQPGQEHEQTEVPESTFRVTRIGEEAQ